MLSRSSARRRSASVRGLMPAHECSSSEKRRAPSERSCTRSAVHFAPMISAHAATAHEVDSWTGFMVRIAFRIVVKLLIPRRWAVHPAAPEHRRDHVELRELLVLELEGIAIEDDEIGEIAGQKLSATVLIAREPRRIDRCRLERLVERKALLGMPRPAVVDRPQNTGADPSPRV